MVLLAPAADMADQQRRVTDALLLWLANTGQLTPMIDAPEQETPERQQATATATA